MKIRIFLLALICLFVSCGESPLIIDNHESNIDNTNPQNNSLLVEIKGEVKHPGIYEIKSGTTIYELIALSGGLTDFANTSEIFLASRIIEDSLIVIPSTQVSSDSNNLININKASIAELITIKHIGPSIAQKIIDYRTTNGPFKQIEEIKNVSGISENIFSKIKDYICI